MKHQALLAAAVLGMLGACEVDVSLGTGTTLRRGVVAERPWQYTTALDLLFVVDNTDGMSAKQDELAVSFAHLMDRLGYFDDPDGNALHVQVGIVSTDMGVGASHAVPGCTAAGDGGMLSGGTTIDFEIGVAAEPYDPGDLPRPGIGGNTADGLPGEGFAAEPVADTFARLARLGSAGCPFEQPLAAMRTAIEQDGGLENQLVRPGAALAVVVLSSEDDCSVKNPEIFNPGLDGTGEVDKFRCFRHGLRCDGDDVWLVGGMRDGCKPREDSQYISSVGSFVDFLRQKKDPGSLVVSGVIGDSDVVEVRQTMDDGLEVVSYECDGVTESRPAIRLQSFVEAFDDKGEVAPLCGEKPFHSLAATAHELRKSLGTACLDGDLADMDADEPGLQHDCVVHLRSADGSEHPTL